MPPARQRQPRIRFLVPEVIQTSAMDCGPACLKSVLDGLGREISYGRLREACQTDVDGTSIDTMEALANLLGLEAEQQIVPLDHVYRAGGAFPCIAVLLVPGGITHFVILWNRVGPWIQVMDPGTGRRWVHHRMLQRQLLVHSQDVPADWWRSEVAGPFAEALAERLDELRPSRPGAEWVERALADPSWRSLAALDAATRAVAELVSGGAVARGKQAEQLLEHLVARPGDIPASCWSVREAGEDPELGAQVRFTGAVLLRFSRELRPEPLETARLPERLGAALTDAPPRPLRSLAGMIAQDGLLAPAALLGATALAAAGAVAQAALLRALLEGFGNLALWQQRAFAMLGIAALFAVLVATEWGLASGLMRLGRLLEGRFRLQLFQALPRIDDRYFQSRLTSDMASRGHSIHSVRGLPAVAAQLCRAVLEAAVTTAAIIWVAPSAWVWALGALACSIALPLLLQRRLSEEDLRLRTHAGALSRFYLDALLGLVAIRVHGGERTLSSEHELVLTEWTRCGLRLQAITLGAEALAVVSGHALAAAVVLAHLASAGPVASVLLIAFWALRLPDLGAQVARSVRAWAPARNSVLRLLEPLGAASGPALSAGEPPPPPERAGLALRLDRVTVKVGGHPVLHEVSLELQPGEHLAVVGESGSGKTTLLGLMMGLYRPSDGAVQVDGRPLDDAGVAAVRARTAWVDPAVQLWNTTLFENLHYGTAPGSTRPFARVLSAADLHEVVSQFPQGLQTRAGEGGGLVSGGQGQRVRLGRALLRGDPRLALLDEPFRGLDRGRREALLSRAREWWKGTTLVCATHDIEHTTGFDKVAVLKEGRLVEVGPPSQLAADPSSHYAALLDADRRVREAVWSRPGWKRLRLADGRLVEAGQ